MSGGAFVLGRKLGRPEEFVGFWEQLYQYPKEELYTDNIGKPLTPTRILHLYEWKNGSKLSGAKQKSVEENCIARRNEVTALSKRRFCLSVLVRVGLISPVGPTLERRFAKERRYRRLRHGGSGRMN